MDICKSNPSYNSNKLIDLLYTAKSLYERLTKDVCQYAKEIEKFQDYYQRYDLNNNVMFCVMEKKLNKLLELFYISVANHLAVTSSVRGIGERIIKPVSCEYGTTTTIRYQNICKACTDCNDYDKPDPCDPCRKKCNRDRFIGCRDLLKVQTTVNVATYDNISICKNIENCKLVGYILTIGKLTYCINNYSNLHLTHSVRVPKKCLKSDTSFDECGQPYDEEDRVTSCSVQTLYEFIDKQIAVLGDIETVLVTNIEYIDKYIRKFKCMKC